MQKNFYSRYCIVDLLSLLQNPRAPYTNIYTSYHPSVLFPSCHFFSYPSLVLYHRSTSSENVLQRGTSSKLTVTYANSQAHKIYLLGPNILHALVLQSPILLTLLISVSGYERSNLSERQYSVPRRPFRRRYAYDYK